MIIIDLFTAFTGHKILSKPQNVPRNFRISFSVKRRLITVKRCLIYDEMVIKGRLIGFLIGFDEDSEQSRSHNPLSAQRGPALHSERVCVAHKAEDSEAGI